VVVAMQLEYSIQMGDQVTTAYGAADCRLLNPFGDRTVRVRRRRWNFGMVL
jgi:hypothetical protein